MKTALVDSKNKMKCLVAAEKYCQLLMSVYLVDKTQSNRRQFKNKKKKRSLERNHVAIKSREAAKCFVSLNFYYVDFDFKRT